MSNSNLLDLGVIEAAVHLEDARFCYYCGRFLDPMEIISGEPNEKGLEKGLGKCSSCRITWSRLFSFLCPICTKDKDVAAGMVHINAPTRAYMDAGKVVRATGTASCDSCNSNLLYAWELKKRTPVVEIIGYTGFGEVRACGGKAKEIVAYGA